MNDDYFEDTINNLEQEVSELSNTNQPKSIKKENKHNIFNFDMLNLRIVSYAILPCLILAFFFAWKPSFLFEDIIDKQNIHTRKLSYKKLIVATIVVSSVIIISILFIKIKT